MKRLIIYDRKSMIGSKNRFLKADQSITIETWFLIGITTERHNFCLGCLWWLRSDIILLQDYSWIKKTEALSFNFFEILQNHHLFFGVHSGFIPTFLEINRQYASIIPKRSERNFFHQTVQTKFFWCWHIFLMPNSSVFFLCCGHVKNL